MWEWFNGKKTVIGTLLLLFGAVVEQVLVGMWGVSGSWVGPFIQTCDWFGMLFGGTGLAHKGLKSRMAPPDIQ